jgi:copper transport protein
MATERLRAHPRIGALAGLLAGLLIWLTPGAGLAHAQLRASDPAEGAVVASAPAMVTLDFNEPVAPLVLRWIAPDGTATDVAGMARNATVAVTPPGDLDEGTHLLSWRVVSDDGHPVGGTLTFHLGAPSAAPPTATDLAAGAARAAATLRLGLTLALVGAVGIAVFTALVARTPATGTARAVATVSAILALPLGAGLLGAQGLDMLSLPPAALATAAPWQAALGAPVAATVALAVIAALLGGLAARASAAPLHVTLAAAAWILASLSFAASGHAAVAPPQAVATPAVALHAMALLFWMGALLPLPLALGALGADGAEVLLRRFSSLAVPMVALLVLSGTTLARLQAGSPTALLGSAYGAVLAAKLALVAALLALALRNRRVLTPALAAGDPSAPPRLARAIRAEIVLGLAVLALASAFRLTPPPRALVETAEPLFAHIHADRAMADIRLTPGRAGPVEVSLGFQTGDFAELVPKEVEVIFAQPSAGIEPIRLEAQRGGDGLWHAGPVTLPRPGDWEVTIRLLVTDFESVTLTEKLTLPD